MSVVLVLSMTSSQAVMLLADSEAKNILGVRTWNNSEGAELAEALNKNYQELLSSLKDKQKIVKVYGVEGPGSFTGLRVSSAYLKGLSTALDVPLIGIASYDLFGEAFAFSLRPAKAAQLTLEECVERQFKFLQIEKNSVTIVSSPISKKILGLKDCPYWPTAEELLLGLRRSLSKNTFNLNYGYTPEFVLAKGT